MRWSNAYQAKPKEFRYGIAGVSGVAAFSVSQFLFTAGVPIAETNKVVFTGGAPTLTALAGGHVDFAGQQRTPVEGARRETVEHGQQRAVVDAGRQRFRHGNRR